MVRTRTRSNAPILLHISNNPKMIGNRESILSVFLLMLMKESVWYHPEYCAITDIIKVNSWWNRPRIQNVQQLFHHSFRSGLEVSSGAAHFIALWTRYPSWSPLSHFNSYQFTTAISRSNFTFTFCLYIHLLNNFLRLKRNCSLVLEWVTSNVSWLMAIIVIYKPSMIISIKSSRHFTLPINYPSSQSTPF